MLVALDVSDEVVGVEVVDDDCDEEETGGGVV